MIRTVSASSSKSTPGWHATFLKLLPAIRLHARISFRHLDPEAREEAVQSVICNACAAIARLAELGKLDLAYGSVLARYGVVQVRDGRVTGGRLNCRDVASGYCQRKKHLAALQRLDRYDAEENAWQEAVVQDIRLAPVPDIVSFRIDFADWLKSLGRRDRRIAERLALGHRTQDVARRFKVSEARVSQLRSELADSWRKFVGDVRGNAAA